MSTITHIFSPSERFEFVADATTPRVVKPKTEAPPTGTLAESCNLYGDGMLYQATVNGFLSSMLKHTEEKKKVFDPFVEDKYKKTKKHIADKTAV